jgi:hypothetical protein
MAQRQVSIYPIMIFISSSLVNLEVAEEILYPAGNKEFYIILPKFARKVWRLKRLAPTWFRKHVTADFMKTVEKSLKRASKRN